MKWRRREEEVEEEEEGGGRRRRRRRRGRRTSTCGLRLMYSARGQLGKAYWRWYEYTLEPWGITIVSCDAAMATIRRAYTSGGEGAFGGWVGGIWWVGEGAFGGWGRGHLVGGGGGIWWVG